ncbi:MAG: hypothetical protein KKB13_26955 [Chloroflexi bacterium]|nr:hypothetical protein [Chloroflexota bacterium]
MNDPLLPAYTPLSQRAQQRGLTRYAVLAAQIETYLGHVGMAQLWQHIFQVDPPVGLPLQEAESAFCERVSRELFPVDLDAIEAELECGASVLALPIYIEGSGVPWEVDGLEELDDYFPAAWPMVAAVVMAWAGENPASIVVDGGELVENWWAVRGWANWEQLQPHLQWLCDPTTAIERLQRLPPPLDGLASLYWCVAKCSGNPFLDYPPGPWQGDYMDFCWEWCWDVADIQELTRLYAEVRDDLDRLLAYIRWYYASSDAAAQVCEVLLGRAPTTPPPAAP